MQTSTSIQDLKRTSKQDTDDLVNDILKELQTTPLMTTTSLPAPSNHDITFAISDGHVVEETKTKKNQSVSFTENAVEYLQILKMPILLVAIYFICHNNITDSLLEQYAPLSMKYESSFLNKLFKALVLSSGMAAINHFS